MFKTIQYDLRFGLFESKKKYLLITLFGLLTFACLISDAVHFSVFFTGSINNIEDLSISFGDVILIELGSCLPKLQDTIVQTGFSFPTMWFLLNILPCYLTLNYTAHDLSGGGIQVITRLQRKTRWWTSKCALSTITVILYYIVIYAVITILCSVFGFELSFIPDEDLFLVRFNAIFLSADTTEFQMFLALCLMPCIVTATLSLVQMMLTLFIKPVFAYIAVCAYMASSVLCASPFFIANYAMPVRSSAVGVYNFDFISCLAYSAVIAAIALIIGKLKIVRMDIL